VKLVNICLVCLFCICKLFVSKTSRTELKNANNLTIFAQVFNFGGSSACHYWVVDLHGSLLMAPSLLTS
jgi:hypothetical protein